MVIFVEQRIENTAEEARRLVEGKDPTFPEKERCIISELAQSSGFIAGYVFALKNSLRPKDFAEFRAQAEKAGLEVARILLDASQIRKRNGPARHN